MKFATALALTSVAAGVSAWSDTFGTIDDQSFSVVIKDPWKSGLDHANTAAVSVNTIVRIFLRHHQNNSRSILGKLTAIHKSQHFHYLR